MDEPLELYEQNKKSHFTHFFCTAPVVWVQFPTLTDSNSASSKVPWTTIGLLGYKAIGAVWKKSQKNHFRSKIGEHTEFTFRPNRWLPKVLSMMLIPNILKLTTLVEPLELYNQNKSNFLDLKVGHPPSSFSKQTNRSPRCYWWWWFQKCKSWKFWSSHWSCTIKISQIF